MVRSLVVHRFVHSKPCAVHFLSSSAEAGVKARKQVKTKIAQNISAFGTTQKSSSLLLSCSPERLFIRLYFVASHCFETPAYPLTWNHYLMFGYCAEQTHARPTKSELFQQIQQTAQNGAVRQIYCGYSTQSVAAHVGAP